MGLNIVVSTNGPGFQYIHFEYPFLNSNCDLKNPI